jgi:PIN domain nuclease of toxin-antitoxin system
VRLLIDTHVLIWWTGAAHLLSQTARDSLLAPSNEIVVSAATAWEIALKQRLGKLAYSPRFLADFDANVLALSFLPMPVTAAHMVAGAELTAPHKDPFNRMLAGQALVEQMAVVTADAQFQALGVHVVW